jgi:hypothetical protein
MNYTKYKLRKCKSLHDCNICGNRIKYNEYYFDGGYGKRVHKYCAEKEKSNEGK